MNAMISWLHSPSAERLGWMLVHSLWQLALLAGIYFLIRQLLRRSSAAARYLAACAIMVCMVMVLPLTALLVQGRPLTAATRRVIQPASATVPAPVPPPPAGTFSTEIEPPRTTAPALSEPAVTPVRIDWKERLDALFTAVLPWMVTVWIVGVFALATRQFGGWIMLLRLCGTGAEPVDEVLAGKLRNIAQRLGVRRVVRLISSVNVAVPSAIGHLKPVILLPASLLSGLSTQQIEAILAHELAHIRRHDYLINLIQLTCETVLFYHPAVWWISREIRREREHCCDDLALQVCGDRIAYARTLATLEERRFAVTTAAMAATGGSLMQRIRRIVGQPVASEAPRGTWLAGMLVVLSVCVIVPLAISAGSQRQNEDPGQPTEINRNLELVAKLKQQGSTVYEINEDRNGHRYSKGLEVWSASEGALRTLGQVRGLEELRFVGCDLRRPAFNEVGNLTTLRSLEAVNCKLLPAQLAAISNLTHIEHLDLMFTVFEESETTRKEALGELAPDEAERSDALRKLGVQEHVIQAALLTDRNMPHLAHLTGLKTLKLVNTFVTPRSLAGLGGLEQLDIDIVGLTRDQAGIWQQMPKLKSLRYFDADDAQVAGIAQLTDLESLNIWSGEVTDAGAEYLLKLQKLRQLEIRGNKMTDAGLLKLAGLPRLEMLDIQYASRLTAEGVARFRALRPGVAIRGSELAATGAASRATQSAILPVWTEELESNEVQVDIVPLPSNSKLPNGIYRVRPAGSNEEGVKMSRSDARGTVVLLNRLTDHLGTATMASTTNDNTRFRIDLISAGPFAEGDDIGRMAMVIDGFCTMVEGHSGPNQEGRMDLMSSVVGKEAAAPIANAFGIKPRLRKDPGNKMEVRFSPVKSSFESGEPVLLKMEINNVGDRPFSFGDGGRQRGARNNQFGFQAFRDGGKGAEIADTGDEVDFGGLVGVITLNPGEVFEKQVDITKWFDLSVPDSYKIDARFNMEIYSGGQSDYPCDWDDVAKGATMVTIAGEKRSASEREGAMSQRTNTAPASAGQPKFAIFLVLGHTNAPFFRSTERGRIIFSDTGNGANRFDAMRPQDYPLEGLILDKQPLLTEADLLAYNRQRNLMRLKPGVIDRFPKPSVWGVPFVVAAEGQPLFLGAFWTGASSASANMPTISLDHWLLSSLPTNSPNYLPPDTVRLENRQVVRAGDLPRDPRQDERLYRALQAAGKLVDTRSVSEPGVSP